MKMSNLIKHGIDFKHVLPDVVGTLLLAFANDVTLAVCGSRRVWFVEANVVEGTIHQVHQADTKNHRSIM